MAKRTDFPPATVRKIVERYCRGDSLRSLATDYNHAVGVIRRVLIETKTPFRLRGRPRKK